MGYADFGASIYIPNSQMQKNISDFKLCKIPGKTFLGEGAFGQVYLGQLRSNNQFYAIKAIRKSLLLEYNIVEHMETEKLIMETNKHKNLIKMDYSFRNEYIIFFVMQLVQGGELKHLLIQHGRFEEHIIKFYAVQIIDAVKCLHRWDIAHRDLKLENILVDDNGYLIVIDFGISKEIGTNMRTGTVCGSLDNMAPEIFGRKGYNKGVDWWAVGIMLFELLVGKNPYNLEDVDLEEE